MNKYEIQHRLEVLHELIRGLLLNEETVPEALIQEKNQLLEEYHSIPKEYTGTKVVHMKTVKTFKPKDVINWSNHHKAKVGEMGYFAFSVEDFKDLIENLPPKKLLGFTSYASIAFEAPAYSSEHVLYYPLFLPANKIKICTIFKEKSKYCLSRI